MPHFPGIKLAGEGPIGLQTFFSRLKCVRTASGNSRTSLFGHQASNEEITIHIVAMEA